MGRAGDWAKRAGRAVFWLFVVPLIVLAGIVNLATPPADNQASGQTKTEVSWPDDQARSFAVQFARTYFDYDPKHPGYYERTVSSYVAPDMATRLVPTWPDSAPRQTAANATVSQVTRLDENHALITVSVAVRSDNRTSTRYLAVPVAHDKDGGLVVNALPGMTSAPLLGASDNEETESLPANESEAIGDLLERFFTAYLAGDAAAVAAGPALPGAQLGASPVKLVLDSVTSVGLVYPPKGQTRDVVVVVDAKEPLGSTTDDGVGYPLSYRLLLTKGDRWYVAKVNQAG